MSPTRDDMATDLLEEEDEDFMVDLAPSRSNTRVDVRDLIEDDDNDDDLVRTLRRALRAQAVAHKKAKKGTPQSAEAATELAATKLELALHKAGLNELTPRQTKALFSSLESDEDWTLETLQSAAVELRFIDEAPTTPTDEATDASERIERAGVGGRPTASSQITPDLAAKWPADKWARFARANPEEAEELKRGNPVKAVPGF